MKKGFTLIELLVVIAIIAILAGILFPVFAQTREKARQTLCLSNQKQIGLASQMYMQDYNEMFFSHERSLSGTARTWQEDWWMYLLMPYTKMKVGEKTGNKDNFFNCPSNPTYVELTGTRPLAEWNVTMNPATRRYELWLSYAVSEHIFKDPFFGAWEEPSTSFFMLEIRNKGGGQGALAAGDTDIDCTQTNETWCGHMGGANFLFVDGHSKWHKCVYRGTEEQARVTAAMWIYPIWCGPDDNYPIGPWSPRAGD
ncbi:MAG: DUF1559 domain-containing protein [Armatimonadetes bacterium]|nr:DUF1559 domain-containing protein [Armatimonadota bacterium]